MAIDMGTCQIVLTRKAHPQMQAKNCVQAPLPRLKRQRMKMNEPYLLLYNSVRVILIIYGYSSPS